MRLKRVIILVLVLILSGVYASKFSNIVKVITHHKDPQQLPGSPFKKKFKIPVSRPLTKQVFAGSCYDINWAAWSSFQNVTSTTGTITDADGTQIGITMSANYAFGSTSSIYNYSRYSGYPSAIPNSTVPETTWSAGVGGVTTMCFSKKVTNPVLLLSSLGSTLPQTCTLDFSLPYVVLYDGGGMVYNSSTEISGTEGYAIIMFPGDFTCVTINSTTPEYYTNLNWGIRPQPFNVTITDNSSPCGSAIETASGGVSYKWNGGDTPNQATNTFHQSGTYIVTVTNAAGCVTSASKTVSIGAASSPAITSFSIPQQSSLTTIDGTNKTIKLAMPPGTNLSSLIPTLTFPSDATVTPASGTAQNFTSPVTYTVSNACATVKYTVTVTALALQTLTVCQGDGTTVAGDPEPAGVLSQSWQVLQNGLWVTAPGNSGSAGYALASLPNSTTGNIIYSLRRQVTTSGGVSYDSYFNITVQPSGAITNNTVTAPAISSFCQSGDPALITGSTPAGGNGTYSYQWQSSADNVAFTNITGATGQNFDPPATQTTVYYRRNVSSGNCSPSVVSNVVSIIVTPAVSNNSIISPAITAFCAPGDPQVINGSAASGGNGTYTYQWQSSSDNVNFTNIAGANAQNFDPPATSANIYYRRIVTSGSCTVPVLSNVVAITVTPAITNNAISAPSVTAFCSTGDPGIITGSTPSGGSNTYAYQWQSSTDNVNFTNIAGATAVNYDPPLLNATTYYQRSVTSGACTVPLISNVVTITISSNPATPTAAVSPSVICAGNAATLSVASPQAGVTYDWYDSATKTNHLFTGTVYTTPVLNASTTYYVQASNNSCISALGIFQVTVNGLPASPVVTKNAVAVCSGSTATLTISNPQAGSTYNWYNAASGGTTVFTGTSFVTPAVIASTTYYAEAVNSTGCVSASRTAVGITVNQLPVASAVGVAICPGASAQLTAISNDQNASITWYANASGGSALFTGNTFNTPALNTGTTYYIEATDNTTGCVSNTRGPVGVTIIQPLAAPVVSAGTATTSTVTFDWTAVNGATGYQVSIDGGKTFIAPSNGSAGLSHTVSGLQSGQSVTIIVEALGSSACQLSANSTAVTALVLSPLANQIFVPNAFTPNGDGKNDIVYVHSEFIKTIKFYIYDQWGELLFTSLNQANGWDGTYKGNKEPVGVYVYYVEATMNDGQIVNKKGTVTLLR